MSRILSYSPTPHWFDYVTDRVTLAEYDDEDAMMRLNVEGEVLALLDTLGHHVSVHTGEPVQTGEPQTLVRLLAAVPSVPRERVRVPTLLRRAPAQPSLGDSKHFYWLNELLASVHAQRQIRERRLAQEWRRKDRARRQKSTRGGLHTRVGKPGPSLASSREAAQRKHRDDTLVSDHSLPCEDSSLVQLPGLGRADVPFFGAPPRAARGHEQPEPLAPGRQAVSVVAAGRRDEQSRAPPLAPRRTQCEAAGGVWDGAGALLSGCRARASPLQLSSCLSLMPSSRRPSSLAPLRLPLVNSAPSS